ncbi:LytR family transcriptional attenuator [Frondihabitans sp. PhB188]|nr:LytR family transcriptional attenuator [Frondihabitans sp. PhB188]
MIVAVALGVSVVTVAGVGAYAFHDVASSVKSVSIGSKEDRIAQQTSIGAIEGGANILLVGSDTRSGQTEVQAGVADGSRNDVTILIHLSADHKQMTAVSFPRDLMVDIPSCTGTDGSTFPALSYQQFNTTLGQGLGCTVATVESMTGLTIPYAAEITFDGVISMSNAIGGVTVCVASPIVDSDTGLDLTAGKHVLQGSTALAFLRTRHGVGDGSDLARISSQQVFLSAMMRKIASAGTLGNPVKLYALASAAVKNMTLSTSLSNTDTMVELGLALKNIDLSNVLFVQYPTTADPQDSNRVVASEADATVLDTALQNDTKFSLGDDSTGRASQAESSGTSGSGASSGTSTGTSSGSSASSGTSSSTATGKATSTPTSSSTALPSTITGQAASEATCSVGNGY